MVRTLFFFSIFPLWTLLMLAASFIISYRGPDSIYWCGQIYSRGCLRLAGIKEDNFDKTRKRCKNNVLQRSLYTLRKSRIRRECRHQD